MIIHSSWEENREDSIQTRFSVSDENLGTIMTWYIEGVFRVYDKIHHNQDQPIYHHYVTFDDEDSAMDYVESQLLQ